MQANWSLILNVLLLIGVIVAIGRLMKARKESLNSELRYTPEHTEKVANEALSFNDDIIAVRKVNRDPSLDIDADHEPQLLKKPVQKAPQPRLMPQEEPRFVPQNEPKLQTRTEPRVAPRAAPRVALEVEQSESKTSTLMMFLLAKENRQFAGYELLQTVLASGLRFGEGHLFHRHQSANGQGSILCSLAAATATGVFDLQNIGAFSVRGLCLFMQKSNDPSVDEERFSIMLETAKQLSDGLDAYLLDDQRKPLTKERMSRYYRALNIEHVEDEFAIA